MTREARRRLRKPDHRDGDDRAAVALVSGTVFADGRPRIVNIKGIRMDAEFGPSMIYITNLDKPGFIGRFSSTLGEAGINIATFHVGREAPGGNAIALIEIDGELPPDVLAQVRALPQVQRRAAAEVLSCRACSQECAIGAAESSREQANGSPHCCARRLGCGRRRLGRHDAGPCAALSPRPTRLRGAARQSCRG